MGFPEIDLIFHICLFCPELAASPCDHFQSLLHARGPSSMMCVARSHIPIRHPAGPIDTTVQIYHPIANVNILQKHTRLMVARTRVSAFVCARARIPMSAIARCE